MEAAAEAGGGGSSQVREALSCYAKALVSFCWHGGYLGTFEQGADVHIRKTLLASLWLVEVEA